MTLQMIAAKLNKTAKVFNDISKRFTTPKAYSTYAAIGVVATAVIAVICTKKYCESENAKIPEDDILENKSEEEAVAESKKSIKETVKIFAPVVASTIITLLCIKKSDQKWLERNQLINLAYRSACDRAAKYRLLAPAVATAEIAKDLKEHQPGYIYEPPEPDVEWFCLSGIDVNGESKNFYFQSTKLDVQEAKYHLNRNFIIRDMASLREFFAFLGILDQFPQELDDSYGWEVYSMYDGGLKPWIDFEDDQIVDPSTGIPINCIRFTWEPWFSPDGSPMSYGYEFDCPFDPPYTCGPKE